jgi:hypothetical protein
MRRFALLAVLALALTGCPVRVETRYVMLPLTRPARPVLPVIYKEEVSCLQAEVWQRIAERNRLCMDYAETLETKIDGTRIRSPPGEDLKPPLP